MEKGSNGRAFRIGSAGPKVAPKGVQRKTLFSRKECFRRPKGKQVNIPAPGFDVFIGDENRFGAVCCGSELSSRLHLIRYSNVQSGIASRRDRLRGVQKHEFFFRVPCTAAGP